MCFLSALVHAAENEMDPDTKNKVRVRFLDAPSPVVDNRHGQCNNRQMLPLWSRTSLRDGGSSPPRTTPKAPSRHFTPPSVSPASLLHKTPASQNQILNKLQSKQKDTINL